jgi:16S rRNA (cytosine1402-N4)-methyltransferase
MGQAFRHDPVMADEVVALFSGVPVGVVVDGTIGGGGHALAILQARGDLGVLGLDRDPHAVDAARAALASFGGRAVVERGLMSELAAATQRARSYGGAAWPTVPRIDGADGSAGAGAVVGVLLDLGVSSPQLDTAERGFSYRQQGPLDMRMDPGSAVDAAALVNEMSENDLAALFRANGEGAMSRRIARAIVASRPLHNTTELADVVAGAVPAPARRRGHPARRVFQALRIAVNEELDQLQVALPAALDLLVPGGRCTVIAYHSGEDRIVKAIFADAARGGCTCPPHLPCVCGAQPRFRAVFAGARKPSAAEIERNHRAQSARLRCLERIVTAAASEGGRA